MSFIEKPAVMHSLYDLMFLDRRNHRAGDKALPNQVGESVHIPQLLEQINHSSDKGYFVGNDLSVVQEKTLYTKKRSS
jgi:hypothetical protein